MTPKEYVEYLKFRREYTGPSVAAHEVGTDSRILCEGYTVDRDDFVVEMTSGIFEVWINNVSVARGRTMPLELLRPNKRAHPERTDLRFAKVMLMHGEPLTFASWRMGSPLFEGGRS